MRVRRAAVAAWIACSLVVLGGAGGCTVDTSPKLQPAEGGDASIPDEAGQDANKDSGIGDDGGPDAGDSGPPDSGDSGPPDSGPDASDPCRKRVCGDNASCSVASGQGKCGCNAGYQDNDGDGACKPACVSGSCGAHGTCADRSGVIVCSCELGHQDNDGNGSCLPSCGSDSCGAQSSCSDSSGAVVCSCFGGYQDNDGNGSCEHACSALTCPANSSCSEASGPATCVCHTGYAGAGCSDVDACAAAGAGDGNPCNGVDLAATCQDAPAPSLDYSCGCSTGFVPLGGSCADFDECSVNNGGCGDARYTRCANQVGAVPVCTDIDECLVDNGGCGDPLQFTCVNEDGAPPSCPAHDDCLEDNGGCGHPQRAICDDSAPGAPTCTCKLEYGGPGCAYHQVYGLDLPINAPGWTEAGDVPYGVDNTTVIAPFDRVAYRLQLDAHFVWVEFDSFSDDPRSLGVPTDEVWDQNVAKVTVLTNDPNVVPVENAAGGNIEFWSNCYGTGSDNVFNADDEPQTIDCFGSLQVHLGGNTLLAVNHWAAAVDNVSLGIGTASSGTPDWTLANNAAAFTSRRLDVYVRELATCTAGSCGGHGSCDDDSGIVQCECDAAYTGVHCSACASGYQDHDGDGTCEPACAPGSCTLPDKYCFDDSGSIECLPIQGTSCSAVWQANAFAQDGQYVVDYDGAGSNPPLLVYCDMTTDGGYTLLAVAEQKSKAFGNNSPTWGSDELFGSTVIGLDGGDYKGRAYGELSTNTVRLCNGRFDRCHDFNHGLGIPLRTFFADNRSYDEYAVNIVDHTNVGTTAARVQYLTDIGATESGATMCGYWLGINERRMRSAIGLMGDANGGCGTGTANAWIDDVAIGVGLQSCDDANSCAPLGSAHTAGRQRGWVGEHDVGPWLILGK